MLTATQQRICRSLGIPEEKFAAQLAREHVASGSRRATAATATTAKKAMGFTSISRAARDGAVMVEAFEAGDLDTYVELAAEFYDQRPPRRRDISTSQARAITHVAQGLGISPIKLLMNHVSTHSAAPELIRAPGQVAAEMERMKQLGQLDPASSPAEGATAARSALTRFLANPKSADGLEQLRQAAVLVMVALDRATSPTELPNT
jgi:hypothetical protein